MVQVFNIKCIVLATLIADCRFWLIMYILCGILLAALLQHWYSPSPMTTCSELEKPPLHHGSDKFIPNNLPYLHGPFVGRDSELLEISNMLLASSAYASADVAMVSIFGAPAVGKSTLAIQVGHELARKGISVRYINLNEAHHLFARHADASDKPTSIHSTDDDTKDLILHEVDVTIPWFLYTEKKYVLTSPKKLVVWAKELTNETLFILDNCDDVLQRNKTHENKFKEMLIELLKASKYLRIVTTSRAQMLIVGGFYPYPLKELDPSSAVTLLQLRSDLITREEGKVIAELVGNNPLALGIVTELIKTKSSPPYAVIDELRKHLIQTLNQSILSNSQRIVTVLKLSYNYLDDRIQVCSHYLSHFPGSFHRAAAQSILSMCNLSDPEYCLRTLVERSLLEEYWHTDQLRYQFHRLIREFLRYVQTEYSDAHAIKIKTEFNLNYQLYYSQDILSLSQIYSRSPGSNEIVSRLERDIHNFRNIFQRMVEQQLDMKSALNIAYSVTNSSDFVIELLNCDDCFVELLQALIKYLFKKADSNALIAYYYRHMFHPVTCSWECPAYFLIQQVLMLPFCFSIMIRHGGKHPYIPGFMMCIGILLFARQLYYYHNVITLFIFRMVGHSKPFNLCLVVTLFVCHKIFFNNLTKLLDCNIMNNNLSLFLFGFILILILNFFCLCFEVFFSHLALYIFWQNSLLVYSYSVWYTYGFCYIMCMSNTIIRHKCLYSLSLFYIVCFLFFIFFFMLDIFHVIVLFHYS